MWDLSSSPIDVFREHLAWQKHLQTTVHKALFGTTVVWDSYLLERAATSVDKISSPLKRELCCRLL
jgi:hypothetical protein